MTPALIASKRDPRIDVLRGIALVMIFVDHIPGNTLSLVTLRNFGFSDAAEVFVLLAGISSMLAFGRVFEREGARSGLRRIVLRLARIYLFQIGLLLTTLAIVLLWTTHHHLQPTLVAPILNAPVSGIARGLTLHAVPGYLDILPLYLVLIAVFPVVYLGLRFSPGLTLGVSAAIWLAVNLDPNLNLPNWMNGGRWFFNPFAWQLLFTIGAALAMRGRRPWRLTPASKVARMALRRLSWLCLFGVQPLGRTGTCQVCGRSIWKPLTKPSLPPSVFSTFWRSLICCLAPLRCAHLLAGAFSDR